MALITCKDCENQVSTDAKACPQCGARIPKTKWWLWGPIAFIIVIFVWGAITGPKNTVELGEMETQRCMRNQGDGEWRGSSGVSLETFCKAKGAMTGIKRACELSPARC